jgi:hypothetical protein
LYKRKEKNEVDLPNQEVVNSFQNDRIFKDIFENDRSNKNVRNEGLKVYLEGNNTKLCNRDRAQMCTI